MENKEAKTLETTLETLETQDSREMYTGRIPEICKGYSSSIQKSTNHCMHVRKLLSQKHPKGLE